MRLLTPQIEELLQEPEYRVEGPLKVTGRARYSADLQLPGTLWVRFALSPYPHARILHIDTSAALKVPGVHAVLTGQDIGLHRFGRYLYDWPVLAYEKVLYIGERVAAVAAETREAADEAASLIQVEYEELPAVLDPEEALREGAPILHPDPESYYYLTGNRPPRPHLNLQGYQHAHKGEPDIERVFERAHRVFEDVYVGPRQHQGYIEPHACVVWIERDGTVRVRTTNKAPFSFRHQLAKAADIEPEDRIVVDSMFIGGDFGGKGHSIEEFPCYFLAKATGRPIKSVMTYADELTNTSPRHPARIYLRTAVDRDGRFLAFQQRAYFNGGAYGGAKPMPGPNIAAAFAPFDIYSVPNTQIDTYTVYTNTVPSGHMRAPGATIADLAGEAHVDHIARELGIDPLEFRIMNVVRKGDTSITGGSVHTPRAVEMLEMLRRESKWDTPLPPNHGRGVAIRHHGIGQGKTETLLRLLPEGKVEALYGTPDQGSGSATVVRRIAAAVLSVEPERIVVRYGTTAEAPWDAGAGSSRVTHIVGQATIGAATALKEKLEELAAEVMGWPAGQVSLEQGRFVVGEGGGESVPLEQVTDRILRGGQVEAASAFDSYDKPETRPDGTSYYGYVIEVEVDPATGAVKPVEAVLAIDPGTIINPIAYQGQLDGGFVYGLGNATLEELAVEDGRITTASLGEYKLPTQMDLPRLRTVLMPPVLGPGPFGAKSVGETNNSAVAAAIANAVHDAVGVRVTELPITAERVYLALAAKREG
jgi:carbon-monoxide dehydrogenase large subunit